LALFGLYSSQANDVAGIRGEKRRELQSSNSAIVTLVVGDTDLTELCYTFRTLFHAKGDPDAPVVVFYDTNSNDLLDGQKSALASCTDRSVSFEALDFGTDFPTNFVPVAGVDYTYQQSQRFLISKIWSHPALSNFDTIMRISHDTCLTTDSSVLPGLEGSLVLASQIIPQDYEIARKYVTNLYNTAFVHISNHGISPSNINLWVEVVKVHEDLNTVPVASNEFEVVKMSFMQRDDVSTWLNHLTDAPPFGLFEHKWGTKHERFITAAIFSGENEVSSAPVSGFIQKDFVGPHLHEHFCHLEG